MADEARDVNIEKGVHLSVVVEFCVQNIIVVCFKNNGKEYRGVLLESNGGFFPFTFPLNLSEKAGLPCFIKNESSCVPTSVDKNVLQNYEVPASTQRFSYKCDPFLVSPRPVPELTVVEMKPMAPRAKTIRDIRLRPRQTLCSNCKCAIHEGRKTRNVSHTESHRSKNTTNSMPDSRLRPRVNGTSHISPLQPRPPKRKSETQSPLVLLEDIKHKASRLSLAKDLKHNGPVGATENQPSHRTKLSNFESCVESLTNTTNRLRANRSRSLLAETNLNQSTNIPSKGDVLSDSFSLKVKKNRSSSHDTASRPSPTIKISIGAGAILKIPPRLPDSETCFSDNISSETDKIHYDSLKESQMHKKNKKSARKAKDKDRHKITTNNSNDSLFPNGDQGVNKSLKKHKKKHRHRHQYPQPNPEIDIFKESVAKTDQSFAKYDETVTETVENHKDIKDNLLNSVDHYEIKSEPWTEPSEGFKRNSSPPPPKKIKVGDFFIDVVDISESESDNDTQVNSSTKAENHIDTSLGNEELSSSRPRLLYTWRQDQGLSRVVSAPQNLPQPPDQSPRYLVKTSPSVLPIANSPHRRKNASPGRVVNASPNIPFSTSPLIKDYPLRSRTGSMSNQPTDLLMIAEHGVVPVSEDSQSHSSGLDSHLSESSGDSEEEQRLEDIFAGREPICEEEKDMSKPLMLKIQTQNVTECVLEEGRKIYVGDIVWGKIQGFPWWPGQVSSITVTQRDNNVVINQLANVAWFGSNTMSHVHCCDLFPFLEDFKIRYNKKKKGPYKTAIKQATMAAQKLANRIDQNDILSYADL